MQWRRSVASNCAISACWSRWRSAGDFARRAHLAISHPAVSRTVSDLEHALGVACSIAVRAASSRPSTAGRSWLRDAVFDDCGRRPTYRILSIQLRVNTSRKRRRHDDGIHPAIVDRLRASIQARLPHDAGRKRTSARRSAERKVDLIITRRSRRRAKNSSRDLFDDLCSSWRGLEVHGWPSKVSLSELLSEP